jgi:hypothetical protein
LFFPPLFFLSSRSLLCYRIHHQLISIPYSSIYPHPFSIPLSSSPQSISFSHPHTLTRRPLIYTNS